MQKPIDATHCSYCTSPAVWQGIERNSRGKAVKYVCEGHKKLITVVAELSPSKREKPAQRVNQEGLL